MTQLDSDELIRYGRHFPVIGLEGQQVLKNARVLCIGAGGLGCPALQYLAASGVGTLGIMDGDRVELSNLQRQILFTEDDIGLEKAKVVAKRLRAMNRHINILVYNQFVSEDNQSTMQDYDVVLDATDNYAARYLINHACRAYKKPLVSASIYQYDAQLCVFNYQEGPCYQCLYPTPPAKEHTPDCSVGGVLGVLPGIAGTLQATEAIKIILDTPGILSGKLFCFNVLTMRFTEFSVQKQDCSQHPDISFSEEKSCTKMTELDDRYAISPKALSALMASNSSIQLIDVREPYERDICHIGGQLVPLAQVSSLLGQLNTSDPIVVYCKSGARSRQALNLLLESGYENVSQLEGGILNWQAQVDNTLMRY